MGLFKTKQQKEIEEKVAFNQKKKQFEKYYRDLDTSIKQFTKMAKDAELSGNHDNARSCIRFVQKLQQMQTKVQGLLQRFEMMWSMRQMSGVMDSFVKGCAKMGVNMSKTIDLGNLGKNMAKIEIGISQMDAMVDQMDMVFDTIDSGLGGNEDMYANPDERANDDVEQMLDQIMGRHNAVTYPPAADPGEGEAAALDDTDERLRKMMEDLKN